MERQNFIKDGYEYEYFLMRKNIKSLRLMVDNDLRVVVSAPTYVLKRKIEQFIHQNKPFIDKNIEKRKSVLAFHNLKNYKSGEHFLLLGEKKNLVVKKYFENKTFLEGDTLYILTTENTLKKREERFNKYIKKTAKKLFYEMLDISYPLFSKKIKQKPTITARKMKTKWGSANPSKNKITLNTALLFAPKSLIEYVLVHELCHFYHLNHSKEFYQLLNKHMPDYKAKRKQLKTDYGYLI